MAANGAGLGQRLDRLNLADEMKHAVYLQTFNISQRRGNAASDWFCSHESHSVYINVQALLVVLQ